MGSFELEEELTITSNISIVANDGGDITLPHAATFTIGSFFVVPTGGSLHLYERIILDGGNVSMGSKNALAIDVEGELIIEGTTISNFKSGHASPIEVRNGENVTKRLFIL